MAYDKGRLNAKQVEAATTPGHVADGKGLYLQVSKWGTKSWVFKFTLGGRTRGMGLGPIDELSLKKAREEVERLRVMVREGRDPTKPTFLPLSTGATIPRLGLPLQYPTILGRRQRSCSALP